MRLPLALALLLLPSSSAAQAPDTAQAQKTFPVCARFPYTVPSTVVADVRIVGGAQIADNAATTRQQLDSVNVDVFCLDLNAVSGFAPNSCDRTTYIVRFAPSGNDCSDAVDCALEIVVSGGADCWNAPTEPTLFYPVTPVPARGITQAVINAKAVSYIKHEVRLDTADVLFTWYQVFYYDASGRVSRTTRQLSPP